MYLALDTSTEAAGLALFRGDSVVAEDNWRCVRNHSVELLPHVVDLLVKENLSIRDISGIIAARGPGGFNGLRVGLGTAKGLAFALNVPIAGVSTLAAAAYQYAGHRLPVCAVLPAGRTEVAWAIYRDIGGKWQNVLPETVSSLEDIYFYVNSPTVFAGEPGEAVLVQVRARMGDLAVTLEKPPKSRAHALAELGARRLASNEADDVATLQPLYLRRPPITQPKSKSAGFRQFAPAVIWDMDGVIVDSASLHLRAWQRVFKKRGTDFTEDDFRRTFGRVNKDIIAYILKEEATSEAIRAVGQEKEETFRELAMQEGIKPLPGAATLIEDLDRQGFRLALASSAPRANVELVLRMLGLGRCFQAIVSEEDVTRGKPDPQPFLLAAERLGASADRSVVIEDAPAGLEAAHRGCMKVIGVTSSHDRAEMAEADLVVDSLAEVSSDTILHLISSVIP